MKIETILNDVRYTLSNDNLNVGDSVYYIARGRVADDNEFIYHRFDFSTDASGFPNDPHIIKNMKYSKDKSYEVQTNYGFSAKEAYFKIIKKEKQVQIKEQKLVFYRWLEF